MPAPALNNLGLYSNVGFTAVKHGCEPTVQGVHNWKPVDFLCGHIYTQGLNSQPY